MRNIAKKFFITFLVALSAVFIFPKVEVLAEEPWIKSLSNPAIDIGLGGQWDDSMVFQPSVVYDGTDYKMWYSGYNGSRFQIGLASSPDGINWTKHASSPVLSKLGEGRDTHSPTVINDGGTFKMWYVTSLGGGASDFKIHYATSPDGISWTDTINTSVLTPTEGWEVNGVSDPYVLKIGGTYRMWYIGFSGGVWRTGYATSPDGINWTKNPTNPVTNDATGSVLFDGSTYTRYYHVDSPSTIREATSPNGIDWTDSADNPILTTGPSGSFDDFRITGPRITQVGNTLKMYYGGHDGSTGWRIGLAEKELPAPAVPYFSQRALPWGPQEYDDASSWAGGEAITMERWGCAVTSAAMVFSYYGITAPDGSPLDPGKLNDWLESQPDGYVRTGWTSWDALTRYSREQNEVSGSTILKFRQYGQNDFSQLDKTLSLNNPGILEVPGHFIVATEKDAQNSIYQINDPFYDRTTLNDYGNEFITLNSFIPTSTNLSVIRLMIDQGVDMLITDPLGRRAGVNDSGQSYNEIPEARYYIQERIQDRLDSNSFSGSPFKMFYVPEPIDGEYTIQVFSNGSSSFVLNSFLYDKDANPLLNEFVDVASPQNSPEFKLSFTDNKPGQIEKIITFASLRDDIKTAYQLGWIQNRSVYRSLTRLSRIAERLDRRGFTKQTKNLLKVMRNLLHTFNGKLVTQEGFDLLSGNIQVLLDTL